MRNAFSATALALALAGCTQTNEIGIEPALTPVGYGMISGTMTAMTYPNPQPPVTRQSSLWDDRQARFFTDARAIEQGDILTVLISIDDSAELRNESDRSRTSTRGLGLGADVGWEAFSTGGSLQGNVDALSESTGRGTTERSEEIQLSVAAVVTDVLPNGNLVLMGSQEVRVNAELRILTIAGIVRPSDISPRNTISYDRIAEARISYGGRGRLTEVQQPAYGQQILDVISPF